MITAHIDNIELELPQNFRFEHTKHSQLMSFDTLKGESVLSLNIPKTDHNRVYLNNPERFELRGSGIKEFADFELRSEGYRIITGTLVVRDAGSSYDCYMRGQVGILAQANQDKLITDYDLPTAQTFSNKTTYSPDTDDYACIKLINEMFFKDIGKTISETIDDETIEYSWLQRQHKKSVYYVNQYSDDYVLFNNSTMDMETPGTYAIKVVSPFLFLINLISTLLKENQFFLDNNDIATNSELMSLCLYHNFDITTTEAYVSSLVDQFEFIDGVYTVTGAKEITSLSRSITTFDHVKCLPFITLKELILSYQNSINVAIVLKQNNRFDIIDREMVISGTANDLEQYAIGDWELGTKKDLSLKFSLSNDENDKLFADFDEDLSERIDDFGDDVQTLEDLYNITEPSLSELRRVIDTRQIYEWNYDVIEDEDDANLDAQVVGWRILSNNFQSIYYNYSVDTEVEEIKTSFSTLYTNVFPWALQYGRSDLRLNSEASFTPRVLFYNGANGAGGNSSDTYDFAYSATNGLPATRWKLWRNFWAHRQYVTRYFRIPMNVYANLDINQKQRTREGEFLIEKMVTEFTHDGIGVTKIEGYKVELSEE